MREQAVETVIHREVEMRDLLFRLGQSPGDGLARGGQGHHVHALRRGAATGGRLDVLLGDAAATTGARHGVEVDAQLARQRANGGA